MVFKTKPIVTTISNESEPLSLSDMVKEVLSIKRNLEFMKIKFQLPIKIHIDNKIVIFIYKTLLLIEPNTLIKDIISSINKSHMKSSK